MLFALFVAALTVSPAVRATSPYLVSLPDEALAASPAHRYANMSNEEAYAELDQRGVAYVKVGPVEGVRAPIRLTGPLHGVHVHSALPEEQRATSHFEILDARLALSLDDFCALLERHDIVELVHYTMYRPNGLSPEEQKIAEKQRKKRRTAKRSSGRKRSAAKRSKPRRPKTQSTKKKKLGKGKRASKRRTASASSGRKQKTLSLADDLGELKAKVRRKGSAPSKKRVSRPAQSQKRSVRRRGKRAGKKAESVRKLLYAPPGTRHPAGLAIDVGGFRKSDGRWLSVGSHFKGHIGAQTCGPRVEPPNTPEARELWSIVCEANDLGLFTYVLTPNYDRAHADHFHMEIRGDVRWVLYH